MENEILSAPLEENDKNILNKICPEAMPLNDSLEHGKFTETESLHKEISDRTDKNSSEPNDVLDRSPHVNDSGQSENILMEESILPDDTEEDIVQTTVKFKKKKYLTIADSDSEEDNILDTSGQSANEDVIPNSVVETKKRKHKRLMIAESDSDIENEDEITPHNKSFSDDVNRHEEAIFTTNSKGELVPENSNNATFQKSRLSALCDSDSDDEYQNNNEQHNFDPVEPSYVDEKVAPKPYKKKKSKKSEEDKPKKMSGRDAAKQRLEIKAESQRMVRERSISLPYHKPKSYTLKEFLARRPKLAVAVPSQASTPPSVAIKMSNEQLAFISKKLQEREEEVKQFYKSESESDNDDDKDYIPPVEEIKEDHCEEIEDKTLNVDREGQIEDTKEDESNNTAIESNKEMEDNLVENKSVDQAGKTDVESGGTNEQLSDSLEKNTVEPNESVDGSNGAEDPVNELKADDLSSPDVINPGASEEGLIAAEENKDSEATNIVKESQPYSMDYEFNLDDLEENSESLVSKKEVGKEISDLDYTDLDKEIENFGVSNDEPQEKSPEVRKLSKLEIIKEKLANIKPRLSGCPDNDIDLETGVTKPNEISKLIERFSKHTAKKQTHKNKVQLSIISVDSGEVHKETVAMSIEEDDSSIIEEKPGVRLQRLRDELQSQMAQKRSEMWQQKTAKKQDDEVDPFEGEKEECGADDYILDDEEEEAEFTDDETSGEDEDDEENEENAEKPKSVFIDEEAEETDEEDVVENENVQTHGESENEQKEEEQPSKRPLRRIIKGFVDDSDDDEDFLLSSRILNKEPVNEQLISGTSQDDDDFPPPHQPQASQTPLKKITQAQSKPEFEFLTPISYITGLQNLNTSASKTKDSPITSLQRANEPSPLRENDWQHSLQRKLFTASEISDSQMEDICSNEFLKSQTSNEEELANMCSGAFPSTLEPVNSDGQLTELQSEKVPPTTDSQSEIQADEEPPSTQDLLNICSGEFTGITQTESIEKPEVKRPTDMFQFNTNKEIKSLDEDQDLIISQLIDEEEMENFKRKFDSPLLTNTQRRIVTEFEEVLGSGRVIDSDDEDETIEVKKKKNQKKLVFSDDENSDDDEKVEEEVIDLHDNIEDDDDEEDAVSNADNIDYDSEENEIEVTEEGDQPRRPKASEFLENEAELSESDWDSADEDEKELDTLEFEQGDTEKFNEKKLRADLERIHMRRLLDDDTREVKMLQELLLEDGELHGTGRKRQFRWKNIDAVDDTAEEKKEDEVYLDEEESEEQWRKKRYERDIFLKEKLRKSQSVDDDLLGESQLLKIGYKVMQRSQGQSQGSTPSEKSNTDPVSPVTKQPFSLLNKRGSFLKRSDQVLQRLAEYNKTTTVIIGGAKNSKSFLFQTSEETSVSVDQIKKRKATDGTPNAIKKLRLISNFSPADRGKKPDKPDKSAKAKLFGNW